MSFRGPGITHTPCALATLSRASNQPLGPLPKGRELQTHHTRVPERNRQCSWMSRSACVSRLPARGLPLRAAPRTPGVRALLTSVRSAHAGARLLCWLAL